MDEPLSRTDASVVRERIARLLLGDAGAPTRIGAVELHPHQQGAVVRVRGAMREFGGALLADAVGLGKTYVALAVARESAAPLVVAPAALREMWRAAAARAEVRITLTSVETLSRGTHPLGRHDLVIVDEAHHLRNPRTARYRRLAEATARAAVLLLTATPVHNTRGDLTTLLALFLGSRAASIDDAVLARCVVRREQGAGTAVPTVPRLRPPVSLRLPEGDSLLDALLALPAPLPPSDGDDGGALLAYTLVRQWASSEGALRAALRRRLQRGAALRAALETGGHPTRDELRAWVAGDDAVQLALPGLLATPTPRAGPLLEAVRAHERGVRSLLARLDVCSGADDARAALLRELRGRHAGERIVAFSQFADTVAALYRLLQRDGGVALLTAGGGRVAGGPLSRRETLARFAPHASGAATPALAERIDLLLATDLVSEGVNLQDASVVVHLDTPWTPARLEQRVGRVARMGSAHELVSVYALSPPASAEALLRMERRLREKLRVAAHAVGAVGTILPALAGGVDALAPTVSVPAHTERLRDLLADWLARPPAPADGAPVATPRPISRQSLTGAPPRASAHRDTQPPTGAEIVEERADMSDEPPVPLVAAVRADVDGCLALVRVGDAPRLLASADDGFLSDEPARVADLVAAARGAGVEVDASARARALAALARWRAGVHAADQIDLRHAAAARTRRAVMARIAAITRHTPPHLRPALAGTALEAWRAASLPLNAGAERVLAELAAAAMPDAAWLCAVGTFGALHAGPAGAGDRAEGDRTEGAALPLVALLLLQRG